MPSQCDIPTGLGKTSVLPIWLLALAERAQRGGAADFPRRLVYVVNRRTVVDQATREAESLLELRRLSDPRLGGCWAALNSLRVQETRALPHLKAPVAVSTLRGQYADNGSWRVDPARPAIVLGTVDMIGSRLLFSAYGRGYKTRPLHAAFLAQGALVVHDEAHLEPAFQELLLAIEREQQRVPETYRDAFGRLHVMALTATSRGDDRQSESPFALTDTDRRHDTVKKRLFAKKALALHPLHAKAKLADRVAELTLTHNESAQAVLVFLQRVDDVQKVTKKLPRGSFAVLTGTVRGHERETLKADRIFARFDPKSSVPAAERKQGTVYLVSTSAGEVGVDISADHLVCDLTPFDSMAQRFGRVNRFGEGDATIDVVHEPFDATTVGDLEPFNLARLRTLELLGELPIAIGDRRNASPAALSDLPEVARRAAFSPTPKILAVTDMLFDAWALTSIHGPMPGRPPIADWLHGIAEWETPETYVAWRSEVESDRVPDAFDRRELLELYPLKPHELLRDTTKRIVEELKELMKRAPDTSVWIVDEDGNVNLTNVEEVVATKGKAGSLEGKTILLPPSAGGLTAEGTFSGADEHRDGISYDVADEWYDETGRRRRARIEVAPEGETPEQVEERRDMRLVVNIPYGDNQEGEDASGARTWRWYVEPTASDEQGSRTASRAQTLPFHLASAAHFAREIVRALELSEPEASAIVCAARFHDLGKGRRLWQRSIGNFDTNKTLAKSERRGARALTRYRHELGSLFDLEQAPEFQRLPPDAKELVLHIVAAHHGRARPSFPVDEIFDPNHPDTACRELASEVPRRFARLQRRYGRWGLAYLESLLRAADVLASLDVEPSHGTTSAEAAE